MDQQNRSSYVFHQAAARKSRIQTAADWPRSARLWILGRFHPDNPHLRPAIAWRSSQTQNSSSPKIWAPKPRHPTPDHHMSVRQDGRAWGLGNDAGSAEGICSENKATDIELQVSEAATISPCCPFAIVDCCDSLCSGKPLAESRPCLLVCPPWNHPRLSTTEGLCAIRGIIPMQSASIQQVCLCSGIVGTMPLPD